MVSRSSISARIRSAKYRYWPAISGSVKTPSLELSGRVDTVYPPVEAAQATML
jgi:hypothetical protein